MGKAALRTLLLFALLLLPAAGFGQGAPLEVVTPESAYASFILHFRAALGHLDKGEKPQARQSLQAALSDKWDGGLDSLPAHAGILLRQAEKIYRNGDPDFAAELATNAERLAPDSVETQLALSRYLLGGGPLRPVAALGHCLAAAESLGSDPLALYRALGRLLLLPLILMGFFGTGSALILAGRYLILLMHDLKDLLPAGHLPWWLSLPLTVALLLLPLSAGLSPWWLVSWWFVAFLVYMKASERALVFVWFALLPAAPTLTRYYSIVAANRAEPVLMAAVRARNGVPLPADIPVLERALVKNPDDHLARMTLADLLRREGRFNTAVEAYTPAFNDRALGQIAYNNVAEIYFAVGDYQSAFKALSTAQKAGPPQAEIFFNLGQYYQATEQLSIMGDQYKKAREVDERRADELRQRAEGPTPGSRVNRLNRVMASIPIPFDLIWERSLRGSAFARLVESGLWRQWWGAPSGIDFYATVGGCILALILLQVLGRTWKPARRCDSCGRPICARCHRQSPEPSICSHCYSVFKGEGGVDLKIKMRKRAEVQRHRDLWSRLGLALALFIPGSGQLLLGFTGSGVFFFLSAGLIAADVGSGIILWPGPAPVYTGGLCPHWLVLAALYLVLMTASAMVMRSKLDRWR